MKLITKDILTKMLNEASFDRQIKIIGRALVVLYNNQTASEQQTRTTTQSNNVGFASIDARNGSLTARTFIRTGTMQSWQLAKWMEIRNGYPKICKYHRQLNQAAIDKAKTPKQLDLHY